MLRFLLSAALGAALPAAPAAAVVLQVDFAGVLDEVDDGGGDPLFQGALVVGTPFSGSFVYDDALAPSQVTATGATYPVAAPPGAFDAALGPYELEALAPGYEIRLQDSAGDFYQVRSDADVVSGSFGGSGAPTTIAFSVQLEDFVTATALSSLDLAAAPLDLVTWRTARFRFDVVDVGFQSAFATGALSVLAVPEPGAGEWIALGCLAARGARRRRRSVPDVSAGGCPRCARRCPSPAR